MWNRRQFLKYGITGTALLTSFPYSIFAQKKPLHPYDRIVLGKTGIRMSRMAMGTGSGGWGGSSRQTRRLGIKGLADLLEAAYDEGINFWDSADQYGTHRHLRETLKRVARENVVVLTKTTAHNYEGVKHDLDRFRREIGTDYLDIVLLHAVTDANWNHSMKGAMEALS